MQVTIGLLQLAVAILAALGAWIAIIWAIVAFILKKVSEDKKSIFDQFNTERAAYLEAVHKMDAKLESRLVEMERSTHSRIDWVQQEYARREEVTAYSNRVTKAIEDTNRRLDELLHIMLKERHSNS